MIATATTTASTSPPADDATATRLDAADLEAERPSLRPCRRTACDCFAYLAANVAEGTGCPGAATSERPVCPFAAAAM